MEIFCSGYGGHTIHKQLVCISTVATDALVLKRQNIRFHWTGLVSCTMKLTFPNRSASSENIYLLLTKIPIQAPPSIGGQGQHPVLLLGTTRYHTVLLLRGQDATMVNLLLWPKPMSDKLSPWQPFHSSEVTRKVIICRMYICMFKYIIIPEITSDMDKEVDNISLMSPHALDTIHV